MSARGHMLGMCSSSVREGAVKHRITALAGALSFSPPSLPFAQTTLTIATVNNGDMIPDAGSHQRVHCRSQRRGCWRRRVGPSRSGTSPATSSSNPRPISGTPAARGPRLLPEQEAAAVDGQGHRLRRHLLAGGAGFCRKSAQRKHVGGSPAQRHRGWTTGQSMRAHRISATGDEVRTSAPLLAPRCRRRSCCG